MKEINVISRLGNKQNDIKYFKHFLPLDVKAVVEPFGGSFAVIKNIYKDMNKYELHINDTDPMLFYIYTHFNEYIEEITRLTKLHESHYINQPTAREFLEYIKHLDINEHLKQYILKSKFIRGSMFKPTKSQVYNKQEINILENAKITNEDYKSILEHYKNDSQTFIFLDPPYLFSDNSGYFSQNDDTDMTDIIVYILQYLRDCNCKVMLVINKLKILEWLFKDYIKGEYDKIYQLSKKSMKHLIITNYEI